MRTAKAILALTLLLALPFAGRARATDAGPGVFRFDEPSFNVPAGATVFTVRVERSNGGTGAVSVAYSATAGTAVAGTDFTPTSGTLSWANGDQNTKTFDVAVHSSASTSGKTIQLALSNPTGGATILDIRGTATLVLPGGGDGGGGGGGQAGIFRFDEPSFNVPAGATVFAVHVERSEGSQGAVTVDYSAAAGTAAAGTDFVPTSGTLSWGNGDESTKTFNVTILPSSSSASAAGKTIQLTLSNPTGGATILATRGTALLVLPGGSGGGGDDGGGSGSGGGVLGFDEHDYVGLPEAGKAVITVEREGSAAGAVTVNYSTVDGTAVGGKDYTPTSGTLSWAAGDESKKTFFVTLLANGAGTVKLLLGNATGGATISQEHSQALLSIGGPGHEDHPPGPTPGSPGTIKFDEDSFQVVAGETATITVFRSGGHAGAVSVQYATSDGSGVAGTDYTTETGTLSWGADDQAPKTFQVPTFANPKGSGKTVRLTLSNPTGGATLGDGKIATLFLLDTNGDTSACADDDTTLCAAGGRFRVRVTWRTGQGQTGPGHASKLNANSGAFWFFSPDNSEMLVKVLDACNGFNHFWVFYAATTNVGFSVEVTDTRTGLVKTYSNPYGLAAPSINDTGTFATCK